MDIDFHISGVKEAVVDLCRTRASRQLIQLEQLRSWLS